jgi:hypothetical protein
LKRLRDSRPSEGMREGAGGAECLIQAWIEEESDQPDAPALPKIGPMGHIMEGRRFPNLALALFMRVRLKLLRTQRISKLTVIAHESRSGVIPACNLRSPQHIIFRRPLISLYVKLKYSGSEAQRMAGVRTPHAGLSDHRIDMKSARLIISVPHCTGSGFYRRERYYSA